MRRTRSTRKAGVAGKPLEDGGEVGHPHTGAGGLVYGIVHNNVGSLSGLSASGCKRISERVKVSLTAESIAFFLFKRRIPWS